MSAGAIQIQTLTSGGATDKSYIWVPASEAGDYGLEGEGWLDNDEGSAAVKTFADGEGFLTSNDFGDGATITFAGQVPTAATEFVIPNNFAVAGNCTPANVDIQSIVVEGDGVSAGAIQIQTLTSGGATDKSYIWVPASEAGDYGLEGEGWLDNDEGSAAVKTFAPGEGFLTSNDFGEGAMLKIPSPVL